MHADRSALRRIERAHSARLGRRRIRALRITWSLALGLALLFVGTEAHAYTWMIRHGYTSCATCHLDPSGGGILTPYGRASGALLLSSKYGDDGADDENHSGDFLAGAVKLPEELMLGGDGRMIYLSSKLEDTEISREFFIMQADLQAAVNWKHVLASASVGYAENGAYGAAITNAPEKNLVSRVHWLGYEFDQDGGLVARAGRMGLPFGIRNIEHTLWAREDTRTNVNDDQQLGVTLAWSPHWLRAEVMAILGNYQIKPDDYRERGYSLYAEWLPTSRLALGASSLITHRDVDPTYLRETWHHVHGLYGRWATDFEPLVVLAEADFMLDSPKQDFRRKGVLGYLQADLEPVQGVHFAVTGELSNFGLSGTPMSWGVWASQFWFIVPHLDLRLDNVYQSLASDSGRTDSFTLIAQAHLYL